ncbi:integrase core domain protein-like protein, partial [Dinothrombium tinctorium]
DLLKARNVPHRISSIYHPEANGQAERTIRTIKEILTAIVNQKKQKWEKYLPYATFANNTAQQEATGFSPFQLVYGRDPVLPTDIMLGRRELIKYREQSDEELSLAHFKQMRDLAAKYLERSEIKKMKSLGKKQKSITFEKGQLVLSNIPIGAHKKGALEAPYHGPYRIIMRLNKNSYEVEQVNADENGHKFQGVVHVKYMKPYLLPSHILTEKNEVDEVEIQENITEIDSIPKPRKRGRPAKRKVPETKGTEKRKRGRPRKPCQFA